MNQALVDQVVQAVLYEGYILYPYRASARKNRQRFTFGRVYPQAYSRAQKNAEPCEMQTQCLAESTAPGASLEIVVRFLHPMEREIGAVSVPLRELPPIDEPDFFHEVPELEIEGRHYHAWQEAVERAVHVPAQNLAARELRKIEIPFSFPAAKTIEALRNQAGEILGVILRRQQAVAGTIEVTIEPLDDTVRKITVRILNQTPVPAATLGDEEDIVLRTFASTHTILSLRDGAFLSQIDPPPAYADATCRQIGTWPILVGDEARQERDTMISSPIILYDYPQIAPESPGTLFDGGEIDEILTLRIQTMTDDEKKEMRGVDEQARLILERTENLDDKQLIRMHGAMRETVSAPELRHPVSSGQPDALDLSTESFFNPATKPQSFSLDGVSLTTGDRVRVRPKSRADIMDMALAGKIAIIESIEQDAEDKLHLALIMEDDPGKDLGYLRQPGHRFFYTIDEVELLREGE